jgi:hypothetical protein
MSRGRKAVSTVVPADSGFDEVVLLIEQSRKRAMQAVNAALVELYW